MINKSILIAALARDCNASIISNIPKIEQLRKEFKESHVIIVENDSKDGTKETLIKWAKDSKGIHLIMNDFKTITVPIKSINHKNPSRSMHRISKMAQYRNMYMDYARIANFNIDYLIVIDIDVFDFSIVGIINSIKNAPKDWGGIFANGNSEYNEHLKSFYDCFAFVPIDSKTLSLKFNEMRRNAYYLVKHLRKIRFFKCISSFGGIGIYKWDLVKDLSYTAEYNTECKISECLCEHIPFNNNIIKKGACNYISSEMKVSYGHLSLKRALIRCLHPDIFNILYFLRHWKVYHN